MQSVPSIPGEGSSRERHRSVCLVGVVALGAMLLAGCGGDDGDGAQSSASTTTVLDATTSTAPRVGTGEAELLVQGARVAGANGIAVDADGRLFVASVWGREIVVMDPETGEVLDRYGPDDGVQSPDDVAFGPDGSLYWTDFFTGEVGRRQPDGTVTKQHVGSGVNPIAFSDDGRLFVAQAFQGDGLYELDAELTAAPRVVIPDSATPPFTNQLNGMDVGPDGRLYAPRPLVGTIVSIDVDTGVVTEVAGGLANPLAVDFDSDGQLFAVTGGSGIARVDLSSGGTTPVGQVAASIDNMAFAGDDRLFVTDNAIGSVHEVFDDGSSREISPSGLIAPGPVAVISDSQGDSLYVGSRQFLVDLDARTGELEGYDVYIALGDPSSAMIQPDSVTADGSNLILTTRAGSVQVWDPVSDAVVEQLDGFVVPLNATRFQGNLVVAESTGKLIQHDPATGERKTLTDALEQPVGLAAAGDDLWVADRGKGAVFQVVADGAVLSPPSVVVDGLDMPEGLARDDDGTLLVVETGRRQLLRIDPATGKTSTVASDLDLGAPAAPNNPPIWNFNGVAVDQSGTIYITGDITPAVYRIEAPDH